MLSVARVFMILAGFLGLPSVACSVMCSSLIQAGPNPPPAATEGIFRFLFYASLIASIGSIVVGVKAKKIGKAKTSLSCLLFAACFAGLILQLNPLGITSAGLLFLAAIMAFVASDEEFQSLPRPITSNYAG
jgi:hypothetical protein